MSTHYITSLAEAASVNHTTFNTLAAAVDGKLTDMDDGTHNFSAINVDGGALDTLVVGGATPAPATFSTIAASGALAGPAWHVTMGGGSQAVASAATDPVQFDSEVLDSNSNFNTGTYTATPTVQGFYFVIASVMWLAAWNANKQMSLFITAGSATNPIAYKETVGTNAEGVIVYDIIECDGATTALTVYVINGDSASRSIQGNTYQTFFAGWRIQ